MITELSLESLPRIQLKQQQELFRKEMGISGRQVWKKNITSRAWKERDQSKYAMFMIVDVFFDSFKVVVWYRCP